MTAEVTVMMAMPPMLMAPVISAPVSAVMDRRHLIGGRRIVRRLMNDPLVIDRLRHVGRLRIAAVTASASITADSRPGGAADGSADDAAIAPRHLAPDDRASSATDGSAKYRTAIGLRRHSSNCASCDKNRAN